MSRSQDKVRIVIEANTEAGRQLGAVLNSAFQQAGEGAEKLERKGKSGWEQLVGGADRFILKLTGVQTATDLALKALTKLIDKQRELREGAISPVVEMDTAIRRYMQVAGTPESQYGAVQNRLMTLSKLYRVPFGTTGALAEQLVSSGMEPVDVMGGGLEATLQGFVAMGQVGKGDPTGFAKGSAQLLSGMGLERTPEVLRRVQQSLYTAKSIGNVEINELTEIANRAGTVRAFGNLSLEEYLATMTALSQAGGTADMTTSLKNVIMQMSGMGAVPTKVKALRRMGLKPEDVNIEGENFFEAIANLQGGLGRMDAGQRKVAMSELFGEKTIMSLPILFETLQQIAKYGEAMKEARPMLEAVRIGVSGPAAQLRGVELEELEAEAAGGFESEVARRARSAARKKKLAQGKLSYGDFIAAEAFDVAAAGARSTDEAIRQNTEALNALNKRLAEQELNVVKIKESPEFPNAQPARGVENAVPMEHRWRQEHGIAPVWRR